MINMLLEARRRRSAVGCSAIRTKKYLEADYGAWDRLTSAHGIFYAEHNQLRRVAES